MENEDVAQNILDNTDENASSSQEKLKSALGQFSQNQKRALSVMTVIALAFGAYFLRDYLQLIAIAGVLVYLFRPLYVRFERRWNSGVASALTVLSALAVVIVPLGVILTMAGIQIKEMIDTVSAWVSKTDMSQLGQRILESINAALDRIPFINVDLTPEKLQSGVSNLASSVGEFALNFAKDSVGGIAGGVTAALIFLYVFLAFLGDGNKVVRMVKDLSPLDHEVSELYFSKIGAMVKATVGGQFVIAAAQGTVGAISIYIAGIHQGFFMFVIFLTVLSIIPLGSGIVAIPLGIGMALTGNIPGGIFVVIFHVLVTSNIDNVLRPMLLPRAAYLPPALMLLAVFAGLSMFGFLGIVFGPVIMIVIVTTINLYRTVVKGAPWEDNAGDDDDDAPKKKNLWTRLKDRFTKKRKSAKSPDGA